MVQYLRYQQWKKGSLRNNNPYIEEDEESRILNHIMDFADYSGFKKTRPKFLFLFFLSLLSLSFIFAPHFFSSFSHFYSFGVENDELSATATANMDVFVPLCSSFTNGTLCCDRNSIRSDICFMKGDIRTDSTSLSIFLYTSTDSNGLINHASRAADDDDDEDGDGVIRVETIRPYTRKWETNTMNSIDELNLIVKRESKTVDHRCDVRYDVPAVFFSTGGYTGNVYHEFNDGILPLYITSQHLKKKVVFVILEYHNWWLTKYGDILSQLSDYAPIDFSRDKRTHCFPQVIAGLRIHDELTVDPSLMEGNKSIVDFRNLIDKAYQPRVRELMLHEERKAHEKAKEQPKLISSQAEQRRPKLVILSRNGSRAIINEKQMVKLAEKIGFRVKVLRPDKTTEMAKIYRELNTSDVMVGVHGAAMTHFLFMRPSSVFIQIIPLGTVWAAESYYGEPAKKLGLKYIGYEINPKESSLYDKYDKGDPVLVDPDSVTKQGWEYTKKVYLDSQNVRLNLKRFQKRLDRAYYFSIARIRHQFPRR